MSRTRRKCKYQERFNRRRREWNHYADREYRRKVRQAIHHEREIPDFPPSDWWKYD